MARRACIVTVFVLLVPLRALASDADVFYRDVKAGNYRIAVIAGSRFLNANPKNDAFAVDLAYAYLKLGKRAAARDLLSTRTEYLLEHRDAANIWLALSYEDSEVKAYRAAIADVDRYLRFAPDDAQAWRQRGYAVAALALPAPAASPLPDESVMFYQAVAAHHDAAALPYGERYLASHPDDDAFALDLAYAYIQTGNVAAAASLADARGTYVASDANGSKLLAALFYAYQTSGDAGRALTYGRRYVLIHPEDDAFAMDLAYAELKAGELDRARSLIVSRRSYLGAHPEAAKLWLELSYRDAGQREYTQAIDDVNDYLKVQPGDATAREQREAYASSAWGGARNTTFADSYYDVRFNDIFLSLDHVVTLAPAQGVQPYLVAHLDEDERSGAPGSSQIFSDNVLVTDAGLRQAIGPDAHLFAEAGTGIGLRGQGTITDLRYGLEYGQQWNEAGRAYTAIDFSAGCYSRYAGNGIAYYDLWHAFAGMEVRPLLGLNGGYDSHNVFGNRFVEALYGLEIGNGALRYRVFGVEGAYLNALNQPARYSTVRAMLVLGLSH